MNCVFSADGAFGGEWARGLWRYGPALCGQAVLIVLPVFDIFFCIMTSVKKKIQLTPLLFAVIFTPLAAVAAVTSISFITITQRMIDENIVEKADSMMEIVKTQIMGCFDPVIANLHSIAELTKDNQDTQFVGTLLRRIAGQYDSAQFYWATMTPLPEGGTLVMSYDWAPPDAQWDQTTRPWFIGARGGEESSSVMRI
ncbi:MAG: hypothetical protein NC041_05485 [Bacteroides sp.]|nr:hypothetical protein [Prevotella sp.]MCM1407409.1 hypothetical protein [Treponema brennaborense]MCM1469899.1 hypothetical protein [Bacteroides sp.]